MVTPPAQRLRLRNAPRATKVEIEALTKKQVEALLDTARSDRLHALYVLACITGMRQGEILALKWDCVDFESGTVRVKRTVWKGMSTRPNPHSRRTIKLSQFALRALWDHGRGQAANSAWCFPNRAGSDC